MFKRTVFDLSKPIIFAFIGYLTVLAILALAFPKEAQAERIKDIAMVEGARSNQLIGFGLVVGLDGTGDQVHRRHLPSKPRAACCSNWGESASGC